MPQRRTSIVGITGPVAAGKSALSRRLAALGALVIDVDGLGHRALATAEVADAVGREFGPASRSADGTLDRAALAHLVFGDDAARRRLESIVHPVVRGWIDDAIAGARRAAAPLVVVDCALLFESGLDALCDETVAVDAPHELRLRRAREAHGWDEAAVRRREAAQLPAEQKRARAGRVVTNDGDAQRLDLEARALYEELAAGPGVAATRRTSP